MPKLSRVLETALYVADLDKAATFYADVMGSRASTPITACVLTTWVATASL